MSRTQPQEDKISSETGDPQAIAKLLTKIEGDEFEVTQPKHEDELSDVNVAWFVVRKDCKKHYVVERIWKENPGFIWLESRLCVMTLGWISRAYGDDVASHSAHFDYTNFANQAVRASFARWYPNVDTWIQMLEEEAKEISNKHAVHAEVRFGGSKGYLDLRFGVRMGGRLNDLTEEWVKRAIGALEECDVEAKDLNKRLGAEMYDEEED